MFQYYNANPLGRNVDDCAVRAISKATDKSWDKTYIELSEYARMRGITFSEIQFINEYLKERFQDFSLPKGIYTLQDFIDLDLAGTWLITMPNHITCVIDSVCYDTFYPIDKYIWCAYKVK